MRLVPKKETLTIEFKSDIDCLDEKELVSEIVGMTNTEGGPRYRHIWMIQTAHF